MDANYKHVLESANITRTDGNTSLTMTEQVRYISACRNEIKNVMRYLRGISTFADFDVSRDLVHLYTSLRRFDSKLDDFVGDRYGIQGLVIQQEEENLKMKKQ